MKTANTSIGILAVLFASLLVSCESKEPTDAALKAFKDKSLEFYQNDGSLSSQEVDFLKILVSQSESGKLKTLKDTSGVVDMDKFADFLTKELQKEGISVAEQDILSPVSEFFNVNFFLENSGSMNGYVAASKGFKEAVYGLLADLKIHILREKSDALNLYYVNRVISHTINNATMENLEDYIHRLNPTKFSQLGRENGGDPSKSDMDNLFGLVLSKVDKNNVAVLVSDFIFSPGKNNAENYLASQGNSIKIKFSQKLKEQNLAVLVLKLESDFSGTYYDYHDTPILYIGKRPYYIWFIGNSNQIAKIKNDGKLFVTLKDNGYTGDFLVINTTPRHTANTQPQTKIVPSPKYSYDNKTNTIFAKISKEKFNFNIDVNFNDNFRDSLFFANSNNYKINPVDYSINVKQPQNAKFKHRLSFESDKIIPGKLNVKVVEKMPKWLDESNSADDSRIKLNKEEASKTYGFKRLVSGVYSAFFPDISIDEYHTVQSFDITIQPEK